MSSGTTQVDQPALSQNDDPMAIREDPPMDLVLDLVLDHPLYFGQSVYLDFIVEVADVAHNRIVLHGLDVVGADDVFVAGGCNEYVHPVHHVF
jgi:hypothetical protein